MRTSDFDYALPAELIAQTPAPQRDRSRLLVLHRAPPQIEHRQFPGLLEYLRPGDVLALNNSRVIPARLRGTNARTGGQFEVLLLEENAANDWWVMLRPGKRARAGTAIVFRDLRGNPSALRATVLEQNDQGHRRLRFAGAANVTSLLDALGEVPLPPYIRRPDLSQMEQDCQRYQTVFAQPPGSVAAPTAGLHFTESLLDQIRSRRVQVCFLTLHVGVGTFAPVKTETIAAHPMHAKRYELRRKPRASSTPPSARAAGSSRSAPPPCASWKASPLNRILHPPSSILHPRSPICPLRPHASFIYPPYDFKIADALLTNFHLPRSTLLMLACAFAAPNDTCGRDLLLSAYAEAVRQRYRFFSYGDAMLIL